MKALVLCAGYGTRLGELTRDIPKPMLPLSDRPLLEFIVCNLVRHGFDQIAINLHFLPEMIEEYFGDGSAWGAQLSYTLERELLGTAGTVKSLAGFLQGKDAFLVHYGDILNNQDFTAMREFHQQRQALATLLVHRRERSVSALSVDGNGCVQRFVERPTDDERLSLPSAWVFSGVAICDAELLDAIPSSTPCDLPRDVFPKLVDGERLFAFPLSSERYAIDSPERLANARKAVAEGRFPLHRG